MDVKDRVKTTGWISFLAGIWLLMAPFALGYTNILSRTNDIWLGIIIGGAAFLRFFMQEQRALFTWIIVLAGVWLMIAPYILGYVNSLSHINDMLLGLVVVLVSLWGARAASGHGHAHI